ncbi:hypothetical protein SAMN05216338_1001862 [Bradyrhizobium sp. Rc2d]|uniref:8-oxoguanine DNA glycosylase OGG fold protein n=1 Tax=Bradyrhizobium sp. Rc2d TaxID=1855321 RepID=UPI0008896615|nr:hypothetical protein [Bradyrhizobium sp. Rc2d]SDG59923.1 hypothetical protein SAMN05216338_1001862 [Bradyrhizobium sp. Rc2d]
MTQAIQLPTVAEMMGFGSSHNPKVWEKHRALVRDPFPLDSVLQSCQSKSGKLTRHRVFEIARAKPEFGVIAAIVWGFPRGGRPGGQWISFAHAFDAAQRFMEVLAELSAHAAPATQAIERLNQLVAGVGFASTTKIAYFARVSFREGPALIYDANVIKAITSAKDSLAGAFPRTRSILGSSNFYPKATRSYGSYIEEASALAAHLQTTPEVIELALFRSAARPGMWS